jgi:hypothetical protein
MISASNLQWLRRETNREVKDDSPGNGAQYARLFYNVRAPSRQEAEKVAQRVTDAVRDEAFRILPDGYSWNSGSAVIGPATA